MKEVGTQEDVFVQCALSGFLLPYVPGLLGFRVFGRGIGGLFRTSVVGVLTSIFAVARVPPPCQDQFDLTLVPNVDTHDASETNRARSLNPERTKVTFFLPSPRSPADPCSGPHESGSPCSAATGSAKHRHPRQTSQLAPKGTMGTMAMEG